MKAALLSAGVDRDRAASTAGDQSMLTTGPIHQDLYGGQARSMQASYFNPNNMNRTDMINHMQ